MPKGSKLSCYHCGEDCGQHPVEYDGKNFCCSGCKTVFEILNDSDACDYYSIEDAPGLKNIQAEIGNKYAYLDNLEIKKELLEFSDGGISKVKFFIPSIHCSSCIWLLENLNRLNSSVLSSMVNFVKKEVRITFKDTELNLRQLVELMASINYTPQITLDDLKEKSEQKADKSIYYKLGVAGFSFGNIMLLSFPEYLNFNQTLEFNYSKIFAYLNLVLSLPIIFYAGTDYFTSAIKSIRKKIVNIDFPISLGIAVLFIRSAFEILSNSGVGYLDSMAGLVFFLLIGKWYQNKTYQALSFERNYKSYFPVGVNILDENGHENSIPLKNLKIGQRIIVRNRELIPADAILLKGNGNIDYSFVSGESTPVQKQLKDLIFAGGRQIGSSIELIVEKDVTQSYLTELWNQDLSSEESKESKLNTIVNNVSQYFTIIIVLISIIAGSYWLWIDPTIAMNAFTSVLIVACPCALALTLPFAFGGAMRVFGRSGFYLKKTNIVERLSKIDTIIFDKTGTLTQNDEFLVNDKEVQLIEIEKILVKSIVRHSTHPMSSAIYKHIKEDFISELEEYNEIPSEGIIAKLDNKVIKIGSQKFVIESDIQEEAYSSRVYICIDGIQKGFYQINNKYRLGLHEVINKLHENYDLHLLSGDNNSELENLIPLFKNEQQIYFNQSPVDKLNYVKRLKEQNKNVLMIGDGLNDAGALRESHVGVSIADNIYHFSPACDAILEARKFSSLSKYLDFTRTSMGIVKISFIISFIYNIIGISLAVQGFLTPIIAAILMPISSVTVVAYVSFTTTYKAKRKESFNL